MADFQNPLEPFKGDVSNIEKAPSAKISQAVSSQKGDENDAPNAWRVEPEYKKSQHNVG